MSDIPKPELSPDFTLDDIRKIRDWHYEKRKGMTPQEICADTRRGAERFFARIEAIRQKRKKAS